MDNCIFCSIIKKEIPAFIVYENEKVIAIKDIKPVTPVHVLLFPKEHIDNLNAINEENIDIMKDLMLAAKKVAGITEIKEKGYRVITNIGENGGQTIKHLHFHILGGKKLGIGLINE